MTSELRTSPGSIPTRPGAGRSTSSPTAASDRVRRRARCGDRCSGSATASRACSATSPTSSPRRRSSGSRCSRRGRVDRVVRGPASGRRPARAAAAHAARVGAAADTETADGLERRPTRPSATATSPRAAAALPRRVAPARRPGRDRLPAVGHDGRGAPRPRLPPVRRTRGHVRSRDVRRARGRPACGRHRPARVAAGTGRDRTPVTAPRLTRRRPEGEPPDAPPPRTVASGS